jgi:acyl-CoA thioester hydrolase
MDSQDSKPLEVEIPFQVKTYDIDFGGVVSNLVYVRWLEDLRLQIMQTYCPLEHQLDIGVGPVLLNTQIEYRKSIKFGETAIGRMWVINMTKLKWNVKAEILVDGKVAARAEQLGIFVKLPSGSPTTIPDKLYQEYLRSDRVCLEMLV